MDPIKYFSALKTVITSVDLGQLEALTNELLAAYRRDATIFVIGNGQSAATASAFALDLSKAPSKHDRRRVRIQSLTDNQAAITAWANDISFQKVFTEQLVGAYRSGDVLLAISAIGNSPNILDACQWMREHGGRVLGLAGFGGGKLKTLAHAALVVESADYGHVETVHVAINHYWVEVFRNLAED